MTQFELVTIMDNSSVIRCNVSLVSIFIIPDLLLLTTYFYGIYLFWSGHEYLLNLAGQVGVASPTVLLLCTPIHRCLYIAVGLLHGLTLYLVT